MLKWCFFENKAFWHTFAVLCISVFNISAGLWSSKSSKSSKSSTLLRTCTYRLLYIYNINISFLLMVSLFFFHLSSPLDFELVRCVRFNSLKGYWRLWRLWRLLGNDMTTEKILNLWGMFGRVRFFYYFCSCMCSKEHLQDIVG